MAAPDLQPPPRHAGEGGARRRGRAARHRPRTTTCAHRGQPPVGGAAPADLRGRPPRVSRLPRRDADRRVHHPGVGDRPDPHPPPRPPCAGGPRRRAEPPIDAGPPEPGHVTRLTPVRRRPDSPLRTRPPTTRGRSACAAVPPQRPRGPRRPPPAPGHPSGPQAEQPARHTGAVAVAPKPAHRCSRGSGPGPILQPPRFQPPRLNFLSGSGIGIGYRDHWVRNLGHHRCGS